LVRSWPSVGATLKSVPFPRGGVMNPVCRLGVFAALGKRQNERGPFRGPVSWPNPYSVRRYNELLSYGHNILAECSGNVMRMCGFRGCCSDLHTGLFGRWGPHPAGNA